MVPCYHDVMVWYHCDGHGVPMSGRLGHGMPMSGARRADVLGMACRCLRVLGVPAGTRWFQPGTRHFQLVPAGTQLVPAGTQLVPAGTQLVPAGT